MTLEHLRSVVGFRGYAQRDPLSEYKTESFQLFETLLNSLRSEVTERLAQLRPITAEEQTMLMAQMAPQPKPAAQAPVAKQTPQPAPAKAAAVAFDETDPSTWGNPSRNDPCPCGSGEKFKHCHGRLA